MTPVQHQPADLQGECLDSSSELVLRCHAGSVKMGRCQDRAFRGWVGVAEALRALMAEVECEAHADPTTAPDLAAVSGDALPSPASTDPERRESTGAPCIRNSPSPSARSTPVPAAKVAI